MRGSTCRVAGRPGSLGRGICKKMWASSANKYSSWPVDHELPAHAQGFWLAKQRLYWALQVSQAWSNTTAFCLLWPLSLTGRGCHLWGKWLVRSQELSVSCLTCAYVLFPRFKLASVKFCALYSYCSKREATLGSRQWNCHYRCSCLSYLSGKSQQYVLVCFCRETLFSCQTSFAS